MYWYPCCCRRRRSWIQFAFEATFSHWDVSDQHRCGISTGKSSWIIENLPHGFHLGIRSYTHNPGRSKASLVMLIWAVLARLTKLAQKHTMCEMVYAAWICSLRSSLGFFLESSVLRYFPEGMQMSLNKGVIFCIVQLFSVLSLISFSLLFRWLPQGRDCVQVEEKLSWSRGHSLVEAIPVLLCGPEEHLGGRQDRLR